MSANTITLSAEQIQAIAMAMLAAQTPKAQGPSKAEPVEHKLPGSWQGGWDAERKTLTLKIKPEVDLSFTSKSGKVYLTAGTWDPVRRGSTTLADLGDGWLLEFKLMKAKAPRNGLPRV